MLLLREFDVFLLMGSAIAVAAIGARALKMRGFKALATGEVISFANEAPQARHVWGSVLFGAGWSLAGTCPGPVAVMIGEGRLGGLVVALGLALGVVLQGAVAQALARKPASAT